MTWRETLPDPVTLCRSSYSLYLAPATVTRLLDWVELETWVSPEDIRGRSRVKRVAHVRQWVMWMLRQPRDRNGAPVYGYAAIGAAIGGRHHTTALHAERRHAARMAAGRGNYKRTHDPLADDRECIKVAA